MVDTEKYVHGHTDALSEEGGYHCNPDIADATYIEEDVHHHLHRGLKSRQVAMIAIGGAVGISALPHHGEMC
jgi:amino acid permease